MRFDPPHERDHVADLLPAYINESLDTTDNRRVQAHLLTCPACHTELASWQSIAGLTSRFAQATEPATMPSLALLDRIWEEEKKPAPQTTAGWQRWGQKLATTWQLVLLQVRLLPKGSWIVMPIGIGMGFLLLLVSSAGTFLPSMLSFIAPLVTAAAVGLIFGSENDPGLEIALATPTSPRVVLLCRLALVFGYNFGLTLVVTVVLSLLQGGNSVLLISLWVGPMLLLSGLCLLLSLLVSTMSGVGSIIVLGCIHFIPELLPLGRSPFLPIITHASTLWQTNPTTLLCSALLFMLAIYYVPRQIRRNAHA